MATVLRWTALAASLTIGVFLAVLVRSYAMGLQVDCGCFGSGEALGPKTLLRDSLMLVLALAVTIGAFALRKRTARQPQEEDAAALPVSSDTEQSHPA